MTNLELQHEPVETMNLERAKQALEEARSLAYAALQQAQAIAEFHKLGFNFSPAYGMGGWFEGNPEDRYPDNEDGWCPSSQSC